MAQGIFAGALDDDNQMARGMSASSPGCPTKRPSISLPNVRSPCRRMIRPVDRNE